MNLGPSLHHPKYRADVDGLRAVAILSVVIFHAFPDYLPGGFIGVDIFFVISGYLISTIIFGSLETGGFSFQTFYARRIMRIFPALAVVLLASLTFGWLVLLADELNQLGWQAVAGAGFFSNFVLWGEFGYFDTAAETKPLLHLWSLSIEEQFYIVWPLIVWLLWRWRRSVPWVIAGLFLMSFLLNITLMTRDPVGAFYLPLTRFWELLCGAILAWFATQSADLGRYPSIRRLLQVPPGWLAHAASIAAVVLIGFGLVAIDKEASFPGYWALLPVVGATLLIAAGPSAAVNRYVLSTRVMVWFGLVSFPLYLWHWPLLSFSHIIYADVPPVAVKVAAVLLSILLAWLTFRFIEQPIRLSPARRSAIISTLCTSMVAVGLYGFALSRADFTATHTIKTVAIARPDFALGSSLKWYHGKDDWLFLGNAYYGVVQKLTLAIKPPETYLSHPGR